MKVTLDPSIESIIKTYIYKKHGKECPIISIHIDRSGINVEYQFSYNIYHTYEMTIYWDEL